MPKLGNPEIVLDGMAYFGLQCPLLKVHNLAHFINRALHIELVRVFDFESFASGENVPFPCYTGTLEEENCFCYLVGNKSKNLLFSSFPRVDFWFLTYAAMETKKEQFDRTKDWVYNNLCGVEGVFEVVRADRKELKEKQISGLKEVEANFKDFEIDFLEFRTQQLSAE